MATNLVDVMEVRKHIADDLEPDKNLHGKYICPLCGSGSGGAGSDGAMSIHKDGIHAKCFSCGFYGDRFDLYAAKYGLELPEATRRVIEEYYGGPVRFTGSGKPAPSPQAPVQVPDNVPPPAADFSGFLRLCASRLPGSPGEKYLAGRGLSEKTMSRFMLGYDPEKDAITIPYNRSCTYYSTRAVNPEAKVKHLKPKGDTGAVPVLFNAAALRQDKPCFVVESPLCAISIMQEGGSAVALAGLGNIRLFLEELEKLKPKTLPMLILSLDNDPVDEHGKRPGPEAQEKLAEALRSSGFNFIEFTASGPCKDPNELLQKDPSALRTMVAVGSQTASDYAEELKKKETAAYQETSTSGTFDGFLDYLRRNADRDPIPTGFPSLDKILNGGLVPGLYTMGAVSSLGKTALMVNFADNIAASGTDVLYFSLEMSKYELMARSISRISFRLAGERKVPADAALSTFEVLFGAKQINNPDSLLKDAMTEYRKTIGNHIWYFEGIGSIGVEYVRSEVQKHIAKTGRKPVVFIDYLQILAPADPRATDKHNTDLIVTTLKQLSRDEDIPVFCISSINRMNYNTPINMAAFKESGAIEYGSDVLIGLQLYGLGYKLNEDDKAREKRIRELIKKAEKDDDISIQVRVLKNRNGKRGDSGELKFSKRFNSFFEIPEGFKEVYVNDDPFADENVRTI